MKEYVLTFHTHFQALVCLKSLKKNEDAKADLFKIKMIPVPRVLSSSCGTAIRIQANSFSVNCLSDLDYDDFFELNENGEYVKTE